MTTQSPTLFIASICALLAANAVTAQDSFDTDPSRDDQRQEQPSQDGLSEIIVEAPPEERERRSQLRRMATDLINVPRAGQTVATFFEAICPRVIGLPEAETRVIEQRISENARSLGVNRRVPRKNCTPNVTVIFVPPSKGSPKDWLTSDNDMLRHLLSYQRNTVLNEHDPVRAWTYNAVRGADGAEITNSPGQRSSANNSVRQLSRLRSNSTVEIKGAAVMIELTSAIDKTLGQLADYASMRSFGNARSLPADTEPAAQTILTLFRDEDAPEELTTFDRALISKMYDTSRNARARRFYTGIATRALEMEQEERMQTP